MKNRAFTLAEVLITLAIVGIVAGMTIPSIVVKNQNSELEARFAKSYRTLMYAVNMAVADHGSFETWEWKKSYSNEEMDNFIKTYFVPYLNVVKFCPSDISVTGCVPDVTYTKLNGEKWTNITRFPRPKVLLADGSSIYFNFNVNSNPEHSTAIAIDIDTNGHKKPNTFGLDFFEFHLYPQTGEFLPYGVYMWNSYNAATKSFTRISQNDLYTNCSKNGPGGYCAARVIADGFKINYY